MSSPEKTHISDPYYISGADLGPIWQLSPLLGARKLAPKKTFSCEKQTCICHKKTLIYIKEFNFKLFLALALASRATRPRLGVSGHPPNPQFQGLKINLYDYRHPNYFSRSAPVCIYNIYNILYIYIYVCVYMYLYIYIYTYKLNLKM